MQQPPLQGPADSNSNLELPRLRYIDIDTLLRTSQQLPRSLSLESMSSVTDDSSVDESVSSVGQEEWEKVTPDYDSDIAAHESISRIPTPQVDIQELQQTVLVFPTSPQQSTHEDQDAHRADTDDEEKGELDRDLLSHWSDVEDFQVTFQEKTSKKGRSLVQDVAFPLVKIIGLTARSYLEHTQWKDLDHVAGTVRMTVGGNPLTLGRPLKLLYFGDESLQGALEAKIGSALVAARTDPEVAYARRRYSVLPVSWDKDSPQVELMPDSGANMEVDTCIAARKNFHRVELVLQSGETVASWHESVLNKFIYSRGYQLPDLAIVHISEDDSNLEARLYLRQFLQRHSVPVIIVSSSEAWKTPSRPLTVDLRSPHLAVQLPGQSTSETEVFKRLPIDTDTFLRLNSLQLNKNLACMVAKPSENNRYFISRCYDTVKVSTKQLFSSGPVSSAEARICLAISLIVFMLFTFYSNVPFKSGSGTQQFEFTNPKATHSAATTSTQTVTFTSKAKATSTFDSPAHALQTAEGKEVIVQIPHLASKSNKSKAFEAQLYGDNIVIVRPPTWFAELKRAPELNFTVSKDGQYIENNVTRLHEKIYALSIPKEHAYGNVEVHIGTLKKSKEAVNQTITVDLGSAWVKFLDWMNVINQIVSVPNEAPAGTDAASFLSSFKIGYIIDSTKRAWKATANNSLTTRVAAQFWEARRNWAKCLQDMRKESLPHAKVRQEAWGAKVKELKKDLRDGFEKCKSSVNHWRETHFLDEQKQLLKLWWKLTGNLPAKKETVKIWKAFSRKGFSRKGSCKRVKK